MKQLNCIRFSMLLIFGAQVWMVLAQDTTYTCTAVSNKATVSAPSNQSVAVSTGDKLCEFSVNGASSNAKGREEFQQNLRELIEGAAQGFRHGGEDRLRVLLLGPTLGDSRAYSSEFGNIVRGKVNDVERCITQFREGQRVEFSDAFKNVFCQSLNNDGVDRNRDYGSVANISVGGASAVLVVGVKLNNKTYMLLLPRDVFRRGY